MRRIMLIAAAAALVVGFTACGDDDDDGGDAGPSKDQLVSALTEDDLFTEDQAECIADEVFGAGFSDDELEMLVENPTGDLDEDLQEQLTGFVQGCLE